MKKDLKPRQVDHGIQRDWRMGRVVLIGSLLLVLAAGARGEEALGIHPYLSARYTLDLGLFAPRRDTELRVDGPALVGPDNIDFQKRFGLSKRDDLFAVNFGWRFGEKWRFGAQYFETSGQRQARLGEDVQWGEFIFAAGSGITAGMDFTVMRAIFARELDRSEKHDFGIGIGFHYLKIGAFIEGDAEVNGAQAGFQRESVSADAPLPNIGAWYMRSLSERWAFQARIDWMSASVGSYDGYLLNAAAGFNYRLLDHVGFGLSYNLFEFNVAVDKDSWHGESLTSFEGLFASVTGYW